MITFKTFFEAFRVSRYYSPKDVLESEKEYPDASQLFPNQGTDNAFDPDSLLDVERTYERGDSITFAFVDGKGYVSKTPNVGHETMDIENFKISGRAGFAGVNGRMTPIVAFWTDYSDVKPYISKTFDLIKSVSPNFPKPGPGVIISTRDRIGWYDKIDKAVSSEDRAREMDLRKKLHTETDPRRKKVYMQMLGMLPQMKKPAMAISGD